MSPAFVRSGSSARVRAGLLGLAVLAAALLLPLVSHAAPTELASGNGWSLPEDVSAEGWRIDHLLKSTMFFVVLLFAAMCIWIGLAMVKHGKNHKAEYDHGNGKSQVTFAFTLSALIFFVVDGNLFVNSTWDTSVFPDTTSGSFLLPVKAAIRDEQSIDVGDLVAVTITTR